MSVFADLPAEAERLAAPGTWDADYGAQDGAQTARWLLPFEKVADFRTVCLYSPVVIVFPGGSITRYVPMQCKWDPALYALHVHFESFSSSVTDPEAEGAQDYKDVLATVQFGQLPGYQVDGDHPFFEIRGRANPKRITIPGFPYSLIDEADAFVERVAQDVAIPAGEIAIDVTWHEIVDLPAALAVVVPLLDRTNSTTVVIPTIGLTALPGTLHFQSTDFGVTVSVGANRKSTLGIGLLYRDRQWNRALASKDPHKGSFLRIDPRPIREANLNVLVGN